jgi:hypothetical protein
MYPFEEEKESENIYIRIFSKDIDEYELKWHWDEQDRIIESLEKTDWEFQFDNELPISFDREIFIPKGVIHRIIKGSNDLKLRVIKKNE